MYLNQDCFDLIDAAFDFLESNEMYGDIDEFAFEVGEVLFKRGEVARSSKYYQKVIMAKKQIQKGEILNEKQIDDILISHTNGIVCFDGK
ncbi:hypothetical protein ABE321_07190 [Bacillus paralicheniformis]|uniref:hypothetical protein n=1 Tax=Bacillus paralicheniformis TaxID=1648923 RepID=UPI0011AB8E65|nr:hypothetical protein [Bacillus paralicheniformis]MCU4666575.1 hypothetical protein [Bacillus paralicheniformis]MEC1823516.1 hypothetical protein [Bacillus paralicheniformis]TWK24863.1 hypothetical protein CHCC20372_2391 [Bacillus paralicheniformis]